MGYKKQSHPRVPLSGIFHARRLTLRYAIASVEDSRLQPSGMTPFLSFSCFAEKNTRAKIFIFALARKTVPKQ